MEFSRMEFSPKFLYTQSVFDGTVQYEIIKKMKNNFDFGNNIGVLFVNK